MRKMIFILGFLASSFLAPLSFAQSATQSATKLVTIAVASNLKPAFEEIFKGFKQTYPQGQSMRIVYGSSANLASQMRQGAPYDLFIAADESYPLRLVEAGLTRDRGVIYAVGHLALITNAVATTTTGLSLNADPESIKALLRSAKKIAIANPDLAPYGKASVQYLQAIKIWGDVQDRLIFAENISIATVYVSTGAAKVGITALSLAKSPELSTKIQYVALPDALYAPIQQRMVLRRDPAPSAVALYDYLQGAVAKQVLANNGYSIPRAD
ncbi:molybdate ABC transporter substrate-binding protein [Polynucleobacter sp. CS-Odin-A6]|uniref:molybdate ABC transporter substrate-binding protein n=1 Tax=Polynucleobacter sp. CS-Odin-A6 TaxID=2689106 RepID=UPI001C0CF328|nr:molybdate ABC transporter substrate-binding protein [Polynucleobacter sp. CS-Odin-A6]MBU3620820.1 molybdate ABC transporter substrate-binding protein [Polynucleobacter sp. CS-Odin-A6]